MSTEKRKGVKGAGGQWFRGSAEEALLDVMDALTDWCHPDARL